MNTGERTKQTLIETARKLQNVGLVAGTWGNVSTKLGTGSGFELLEAEACLAITPSGIPYDEMTEEDVVILSMSGKKISGSESPSSEYPLHLAVYAHREDINAIVHTHSPYCAAFSIARKAIPPACEDMVQIVGGEVPVAPYAFPGTEALGEVTVSALEDKMAVIMANHGLVACGRSLDEAFKTAMIVEKAAMATVYADFIGDIHTIPAEDVSQMRSFYYDKYSREADEM